MPQKQCYQESISAMKLHLDRFEIICMGQTVLSTNFLLCKNSEFSINPMRYFLQKNEKRYLKSMLFKA